MGVCLERCPEMLIALLGIWKAGGAYVPLDPAYPAGPAVVHGEGRGGEGPADGQQV